MKKLITLTLVLTLALTSVFVTETFAWSKRTIICKSIKKDGFIPNGFKYVKSGKKKTKVKKYKKIKMINCQVIMTKKKKDTKYIRITIKNLTKRNATINTSFIFKTDGHYFIKAFKPSVLGGHKSNLHYPIDTRNEMPKYVLIKIHAYDYFNTKTPIRSLQIKL